MSNNHRQALARLREEMDGPPFHHVLRPEAIDADAENGIVTIKLALNCLRPHRILRE